MELRKVGKENNRVCRYEKCEYPEKRIDISKDDFCVSGRTYYHSDCYKKKKSGEWKDEQTKKDLQYIKNQWILHINQTVIYSHLYRCLNDFLVRGISSEYLVFVLDYVIKHKMKLNYVGGFKYYVDNQQIKEAFKKQRLLEGGSVKLSDFVVDGEKDNTPKFTIHQEVTNLSNIFKSKGQ